MSTFTYFLDNTSPFFVYRPFSDGRGDSNQTAGWVQYYTGSGYNSELGQLGEGDPYHITSRSGATVDLQFFGTGVILFGTANGSYTVTVDGSIQPSSIAQDNQLFSISYLQNAQHTITLAMTDSDNTRQVAFRGANLTSNTGSKSTLEANVINSSDTSFIDYSDAWSNATDNSVPYPYAETTTSGATASFEFEGRAIAINGRTSIGWWVYQVFLDQSTYSRNASGDWNIPDNVIFFQDGLLENKVHNLTIMNLNSGNYLAISYVTIYTSSGVTYIPGDDDGTSPSNVGIIVGSVIGALAAISLFAMVIYWRRRKRDPIPMPIAYTEDGMEQVHSAGSAGDDTGTRSLPADERVMLASVSPTKPNPRSLPLTIPTNIARSNSSSYNASISNHPIAAGSPQSATATSPIFVDSPQSSTTPRPALTTYESNRSLRSHLPALEEELRPTSLATMHSDEHIDMLANLVVEQLGTRLGGSTIGLGLDEHHDVPPPTYNLPQ
ncbi:hypothetical protein SCHPADRAFT_1002894 [Schizopora paradoxa]|uniref:Transmembrane protein n=1 Tax=Schizopora paradoxa TaxID=27342 RepID=A0A0H2R7P0_9AGAM|nr:hypothetical protein SCHPADRAFT_1002894 [Schizopora paradoxa]